MQPSGRRIIARSLYRHNLEVRIKADKSPVTEADLKCELAIREILEARFPGHGFYGEETGSRGADAESVWLVDPIDGTKAFVRRISDVLDADRAHAPAERSCSESRARPSTASSRTPNAASEHTSTARRCA